MAPSLLSTLKVCTRDKQSQSVSDELMFLEKQIVWLEVPPSPVAQTRLLSEPAWGATGPSLFSSHELATLPLIQAGHYVPANFFPSY